MEGKHIVLQAPLNSTSEFHNYKSTFSSFWWMQITIFYLWMQVAKEEFLTEATSGAVN
jgi:hypothetical protein